MRLIETLKTAFVHGRLTRDELDARAGRALTARTCADLAALTADIPADLAAAGSARPPAPASRRPLARTAAGSGGCLVIAFAAVRVTRRRPGSLERAVPASALRSPARPIPVGMGARGTMRAAALPGHPRW